MTHFVFHHNNLGIIQTKEHITALLENSKGLSEMSQEDIKEALVVLWIGLDNQIEVNIALRNQIVELERRTKKKKLFRV